MTLVPAANIFEDDKPHTKPEGESENWTESFLFWVYLDDTRHLYIHFHRCPKESQFWRCIATILNEDGTVLAYHDLGRELSLNGPGFQQCHAICDEPYAKWRLHVDAIGHRSDYTTLREGSLSSFHGPNLASMKVDIEVTSDTPTYEPMSYTRATGSNAHWTHFTPCRAKGTIAIDGKAKDVDCLAFRDHSVGPRDFGRMNAEGYGLVGIFPSGKSFMAMGSFDADRSSGFSIGGITQSGKLSYADKIIHPNFVLPADGADLGNLIIETDQGTSTIAINFTNAGIPAEMVAPCFHAIGLPQGMVDTKLYYHEWRIALDWDGESGVGSYQGSARP